MTLLLDTHSVLWFWWNDPKLSSTASKLIQEPANRKLVSIASCWEIAIKVSLQKLHLGEPFPNYLRTHLTRNNFVVVHILDDHLVELVGLPFHHRDPFDRMIIAQSICEEVPVVSADEKFDAYGISRIW
jgi:PIN domain nuclease of toxin-antitoxin system